MNAQTPVSAQPVTIGQGAKDGRQPDGASRALRILAVTAVCLGVAALAAATFVLSYAGLHEVARQADVAPRLARGYPLIIDAMLVIVLAAVLALRGAGWPSKLLAWITLLAVLAAAAGADALNAAGRKLPVKSAKITAAVLPWVLVFLAFLLLLVMLRHFRLRRQAGGRGQVVPPAEAGAHGPPVAPRLSAPRAPAPEVYGRPALDLPARQPPIVPGIAARPAERASAAAEPAHAQFSELAIDAELSPDDPSSDEADIGQAEDGAPDPAGSYPAAWPYTAGAAAIGPEAVGPDALQPEATEPEASEPEASEPEASEPEASEPEASEATASEANAVAPDDLEPDALATDGLAPDVSEPGDSESDHSDPDDLVPDAGVTGSPSPAPVTEHEQTDPDMPFFHRMWSAPTPPAER